MEANILAEVKLNCCIWK